MRSAVPLALLLATLAAAGTAHAAGPSGPLPPFFGPLPVRLREGITGAVYLTEPESADVTPAGRTDVALRFDAGNVSFYLGDDDNGISEDLEVQAVRLSARRGLGRGWDASLTGVALSRGGGYLDGLVSWWHRYALFGYRDSFRDGNGRRTAFLYLKRNGDTLIDLPDAAASTSLLVLEARKQVAAHTEPWRSHPLRLAVRGGVKVPLRSQTASQYLDSGAVDVFVGAQGAYRASRRLWLHASVDVVLAGTGDVLALRGGRRVLPQALVAGEYVLAPGTSFVLQVEDSAYPFSLSLPNHSDERRMTTFGIWRSPWPRTRLFLAGAENVFGWKVSSFAPDFTLSAGIQQRL